MGRCSREVDDAASYSPIAGAGELNLRLVLGETRAIPLNRAVFRRQGSDVLREQVNGAVEVVEYGPRHLPRQHRQHVAESDRNLERAPELNPKP